MLKSDEHRPELLGEATDLNPEMETIEQAAIRILDATWNHPLAVDAYKCFELGANYAKAKERQAVITVIEKEIVQFNSLKTSCKDSATRRTYGYTLKVLNSLLEQIKSLQSK